MAKRRLPERSAKKDRELYLTALADTVKELADKHNPPKTESEVPDDEPQLSQRPTLKR